MTYTETEDYIPAEEGKEAGDAPAYPAAFGITFTPAVTGAAIAVLGLAGAAYLFTSLLQPTMQQYEEAKTKLEETQTQIQQKQASENKINDAKAKLETAKQQKKQVLSLFAKEKTLDTLLLDLNRFVESRQGELQSYEPQAQQAPAPGTSDPSLPPGVGDKLKSRTVTLQIDGTFDQIQSIMRSIERLQPLLIVKDFKAESDAGSQKFAVNRQGKALTIGQPTINTSFQVQALLPLTPEEAAAAAAAATAPPQ